MRRFLTLLTLACILSFELSGSPGLVPARASGDASSILLKKTCKYVTKKVHGKKTRVRVCKTVKPKPTPTPTATPVTPPAPGIRVSIPCSCGGLMTFAFGSLWINRGLGQNTGLVTRIDPVTNQVAATIKVDDSEGLGITSGFGSIWEVDYGLGNVTRIDPQTNTVVATISTQGTSPLGVASSPTSVWVANHNEPAVPDGFSIVKIDPTTNRVVDTILVGGTNGGPVWLVYAAGSIWGWDQVHGTIDRIDPNSDKIVAAIPSSAGGNGANRQFATDGEQVWFTSGLGVERIDPATNTTTTLVPMSTLARYGVTDLYGLQVGGGSVWLTGPCGHVACIAKVNSDTGTVESAWSMAAGDPSNPQFGGFLYALGSIWVVAGPVSSPEVDRLDVG